MTGFYSECSYESGHSAAVWFAGGQVALTDMQITVLLVLNPKAGGILFQEKYQDKPHHSFVLLQTTEW